MDRREFDAWQDRVLARARVLWTEAGEPEGGPERFEDEAKELLAIEENPDAATKPVVAGYSVDPSLSVETRGEFPTLTGQAEEPSYPARRNDPDIASPDG